MLFRTGEKRKTERVSWYEGEEKKKAQSNHLSLAFLGWASEIDS